MVPVSSFASASSSADTVTVCAVLQLDVLKLRLCGLVLRSELLGLIVTVTFSVGSVASFTV